MTSSIAIMILGNATSGSSSQTALDFSRAVIASGRQIERLFFYHEAATLGNALAINPQDEQNLPAEWQTFISEHQLDAVVCIASGLKRGIINAAEARRYQKHGHNLTESFDLSGLGQWIEAVGKADRYIVFGA